MDIRRDQLKEIAADLLEYPAVGILGPRQVGKTTCAKQYADRSEQAVEYLDLQSPSARLRLVDAEGYFSERIDRLLILDEIQVMPELFAILRAVIDAHRRPGRFLLLGSASPELMRGSSESLAGRIAYNELMPFGRRELVQTSIDWREHWIGGGFPTPMLSIVSPPRRLRWFDNLVSTFVSRDLAELGQAADSTELARLLSMAASVQGAILNRQLFSKSLTVSAQTVDRYLNLLERGFLVRRLRPWLPNTSKRLVKSPRIYVRDTGLLHALLGVSTYDQLRGHLIVGASWEGYVIEEVAKAVAGRAELYFYRTAAGAELDLILTNGTRTVAVEAKLSRAPRLTKGFYHAIEDVKPAHTYVVVPEGEGYRLVEGVSVIGLSEVVAELSKWFVN